MNEELPEPEQAQRLIGEYRQLLQDVGALLPLGVPETLLPADKAVLRAVLQREARSRSGLFGDPAQLETLRNAYLSLASFLTYEEAHAAARLHAACARGDLGFLSSPAAERAMARSRQIEREAGELVHEFDALLAAEADPLLNEIDGLLADLKRKYGRAVDA